MEGGNTATLQWSYDEIEWWGRKELQLLRDSHRKEKDGNLGEKRNETLTAKLDSKRDTWK